MRTVLAALLAASFTALPVQAQAPAAQEAPERVYEVGQVWAYEAPNAGEEGALIIQRIDAAEDSPFPYDVYHISMIVDVPIGDLEQLEVGHLPVARETLDISVTNQIDRDMSKFSDWDAGYQEWKRAEGGVFDISVSEIITFLIEFMTEETRRSQHSATH